MFTFKYCIPTAARTVLVINLEHFASRPHSAIYQLIFSWLRCKFE